MAGLPPVFLRSTDLALENKKGLGQSPKPVLSINRLRQDVRRTDDLAHRSGVNRVDGVAGRERVRGVSRARISDRGGSGITADIRSEIRFRRRRDAGLLGFERPLLLGTINLTEVVDASIHLGGRARLHEVGNRDRSQEADDGHHDHDFNEREARVLVVTNLHS